MDSLSVFQILTGALGATIGLVGVSHLRWLKRKEREEDAAGTQAE